VVAEVEEFFNQQIECDDLLQLQGLKDPVVGQIGVNEEDWCQTSS
jgi:hypothetical protein